MKLEMKTIDITYLLSDECFVTGQYVFIKQPSGLWMKHIIIKLDDKVHIVEVA